MRLKLDSMNFCSKLQLAFSTLVFWLGFERVSKEAPLRDNNASTGFGAWRTVDAHSVGLRRMVWRIRDRII